MNDFTALRKRTGIEVKSYPSASERLKRLAVKLDVLGRACNRVRDFEPVSPVEAKQLGEMVATILQCHSPSLVFERKIQAFGRAGDEDGFRRRLYWSTTTGKLEIDKLVGLLATTTLAIDTWLGVQKCETPRRRSSASQNHAELRSVLDNLRGHRFTYIALLPPSTSPIRTLVQPAYSPYTLVFEPHSFIRAAICRRCNILTTLWFAIGILSLAVGLWRSVATGSEGEGFTDAAYMVAVGGWSCILCRTGTRCGVG